MQYPVDIIVDYNDTNSFRNQIRKIFKMNMDICSQNVENIEQHNEETLDEESRDEMLYDGESTVKMLEYIMNETIHVEEFRELYEKAAARMISTDVTIGEAILFSYDYFYYFHACLVEFFMGRFSTDFEPYKKLLELLR